jgi:CRP-like cAMP-binding protein
MLARVGGGELQAFLARTPFFGGLSEASLARVTAMLVARDYRKGDAVFRAGDTGASMLVVESGELVARAGEGLNVKMMRFKAGDFFGETTLIEMQPRPFTVVAETDARLHELTARQLYRLYKDDITAYVLVLQNINRELCRRLRLAGERLAQTAAETDDEKTQIRLEKLRIP